MVLLSMESHKLKLRKAIYALFYLGLIGQIVFAIYIGLYLGVSAVNGDWSVWNAHMANGILKGDIVGNIVLCFHVFLAFTITLGGPLQFVPILRSKYKHFHRWNGRIYILSVIITSILATYLIWNRPLIIGGTVGLIGNTLNAILIIIFGTLTFVTAFKGNFKDHRLWAIRTFIVVSGVWFFRVGFGTWLLLTGFKAPGISDDLTGWFASVLYFGSYLIPLAITEVYLKIKTSKNKIAIRLFTWFIILLVPLLLGGLIITTKVFWLK